MPKSKIFVPCTPVKCRPQACDAAKELTWWFERTGACVVSHLAWWYSSGAGKLAWLLQAIGANEKARHTAVHWCRIPGTNKLQAHTVVSMRDNFQYSIRQDSFLRSSQRATTVRRFAC